MKQKVSYVTGEHTLILMKFLDDMYENECLQFNNVKDYYSQFKRRFIGQLAYSFRDLPPSLCLTLLFNQTKNDNNFTKTIKITKEDLNRLERYSKNTTDFYQVIDIFPLITRLYFNDNLKTKLTLLQQSILLMIGLQCHNIETVAKYNSLNVFEINTILMKIVSNLLSDLE